MTISPAATLPADESDLVARARGGDKAAIRTIVRQNNRRLFRVARSILKDEWEAEDAVQEAYVRAFRKLADFEGRSRLATWLTRIVVNEALMRLRRRRPEIADIADLDNAAIEQAANVVPFPINAQPDPERAMAQTEINAMLEKAIDELPETVKTRLHRARTLLRHDLEQKFGPLLTQTFPFAGARCERMADRVIERLGL